MSEHFQDPTELKQLILTDHMVTMLLNDNEEDNVDENPVWPAVVQHFRFIHRVVEVVAELHRLDVQRCHDHLPKISPVKMITCQKLKFS